MNIPLLQNLKRESTALTLCLNIATFGVYGAHYMYSQTEKLNNEVSDDRKVSTFVMGTMVFVAWLSGIIDLFSVFNEPSESLEFFNDYISFGYMISIILWSFKWRKMFHETMNIANSNDGRWLNGFLTFFFGLYYINYKINVINDNVSNQ